MQMTTPTSSLPIPTKLDDSTKAGSALVSPTAIQIDRLVRLHSHRIINTLHHSAHNGQHDTDQGSDTTTWNIALCYPSGYNERFSFANPTKRGCRSIRATEIVQDILRSVEVILHHSMCSDEFRNSINLRLRTAWKMNSFELFEAAIGVVNSRTSASPLPQLADIPTALVHHFFDQLYDRAVSPYTKHLNRSRAAFTYGEIRPALLSRIFQQVGLDRHSTYLDLGSGIGNTVMQAALETGCDSHGIELQQYAHLVSVHHLQQFQARAILWGLEPGPVQLYFGNFLHSPLVDDLLPVVDVVLVNNLKFEPHTDEQLRVMLSRKLRAGAKVVSTRPLAPMGRARGSDGVYRTERFTYEPDSVSWTCAEGSYYIATKLCVLLGEGAGEGRKSTGRA